MLPSLHEFQPTRPLRGATEQNEPEQVDEKISTHAPLAGRDIQPGLGREEQHISTHAPLAGRDKIIVPESGTERISTHAPLAGRDHCTGGNDEYENLYFNPRAPCGARLIAWLLSGAVGYFNPRAPCGARHISLVVHGVLHGFQPTRPLRGATDQIPSVLAHAIISTHAPLAGRDGKHRQR